MPHEPEDLHVDELIRRMEAILVKHPSAKLFVKWTCPKCGERVTSNEANVVHTGGYRHDDCGGMYHGDLFGFMAIFGSTG
jgi:predicted RNA-binding Zn-ribbon protein involved in translation (DUF1610 family)